MCLLADLMLAVAALIAWVCLLSLPMGIVIGKSIAWARRGPCADEC